MQTVRDSLELLLFSTDSILVRESEQAGVDGFIIDWEDRSRFGREHEKSGQQMPDTVEDLGRISNLVQTPVWCRINQPGDWTLNEIEAAIQHGADLILLPMVRTPDEVALFLEQVAGRAQVGILVETVEACNCAEELSSFTLDRVYVGLLDLSLSRGTKDIFAPLRDGTIEHLRDIFYHTPFGVGGLTTIDKGYPLASTEIMANLAHLKCNFTFLRNSFKRDIIGKNIQHELSLIRATWKQLQSRQMMQV